MTTSLDWENLGFSFLPVNGYTRVIYSKGKWKTLEFISGSEMNISIAANVLHYGQACFEGLKAFTSQSGKIHLFRPLENHRRLQASAQRICMQAPNQELFLEACELAIQKNKEFIPPYETGASLYVRPILIGTESTIGIRPSNEYHFIVMVTPVGPYYKNGFKPIKANIIEDYDRAAPRGTGAAKVAGNYAASLIATQQTKAKKLDIDLYLDAKTHQYIEEFATANFVGITSNQEYHTPLSSSILPSITNQTLQILAKDQGLKVFTRDILLKELSSFSEVGACGTAAMITPIFSIENNQQKWKFGKEEKAGNVLTRLYQELTQIHYGEREDPYQWLHQVSL